MAVFGIYIAKFSKRIVDHGKYKDIENAFVIGEVDLNSTSWKDKTVEIACKTRIREESGFSRNGRKKGFKEEVRNFKDSYVKDFAFLTLEAERDHEDDRVRNLLETKGFGRQIGNTEFFIPTDPNTTAGDIVNQIRLLKNCFEDVRPDEWSFYNFQENIVKEALEKFEKFDEILLYLFCRVGKSAISLEIAKLLTKTKRVLILTSYPNSRGSFERYAVRHRNMLGWKFFTKDNLEELSPKDKAVVFLSTAALRVKEKDENSEDEACLEEEAVAYKRIEELSGIGSFDILIIDETHNGISSPRASELIDFCKNKLGVRKVLHNSATPFNDFKSLRFSREQSIQLDFLTILEKYNDLIKFPTLNMISLPYNSDGESRIDQILKCKGKHKLLYYSTAKKECKDFVNQNKDYFKSKGVNLEYVENLSGKETDEEKVNRFQESNKKTIVVTCDKLHTGVTLDRCDCVILMRDLSSAERLIQVMSRSLTRFENKNEVWFYTIGTDNTYKAICEIKRNANAARNDQSAETLKNILNSGKIRIAEAVYKEGEDLMEYTKNAFEITQRVNEWASKLENIEKDIEIGDIVENYTKEDIANFNTYSKSGISKAGDTVLELIQQGQRKTKEVKGKDPAELVANLKKRINESGKKKNKTEKDISVEELIRAWFLMILQSLNTWLLMREIGDYEDIVPYVVKKLNMKENEAVLFETLVKNNETLLKNFIISHNELYMSFADLTLAEKAKYEAKLRNSIGKNFSVDSNENGGGYPKTIVTKMVDMITWETIHTEMQFLILDDIYLEMTHELLESHNVNEANIYYLCSTRKVAEYLKKAYSIREDHIYYIDNTKVELRILDSAGKELSNKNMIVIMNPPYSGNLFLKITEKVLEANPAQVIMLGPVRWLQDPAAEYKQKSDWYIFKSIRDKISTLEIISKMEASKMFGAGFTFDIGIYSIQNGGFDLSTLRNKLLEKILKNVKDNLKEHLDAGSSEGVRVRVRTQRPVSNLDLATGNLSSIKDKFYLLHHAHTWVFENGYNKDGVHWTKAEQNNGGENWDESTPLPNSIPFDKYEEALNFENSTKTNFYRYYYSNMKVGQSVPFAYLPFMDSYKEKWDDKRFYEYFNITEDEQKEIYNFLKKNNVPNLFGEESEGVLWLES